MKADAGEAMRSSDQAGVVRKLRLLQSEMESLVSSISRPEHDNLADSDELADVDKVTEYDVERLQRLRSKREQIFGEGLFADPAWDIFLELYRTHLSQSRISVSSLCIAAAVPPTTALRWIIKLEDQNWVAKNSDPLDGRRIFVSLTPKSLRAIQEYFSLVRRSTT